MRWYPERLIRTGIPWFPYLLAENSAQSDYNVLENKTEPNFLEIKNNETKKQRGVRSTLLQQFISLLQRAPQSVLRRMPLLFTKYYFRSHLPQTCSST